MTRWIAAVLVLACSGVMLGCGMRGPLYLPGDKARGEAEAARPAASEEGKTISPQPAPQAQKRDRTRGDSDPQPAAPAN